MFVRDGWPDWTTEGWGLWFAMRDLLLDFTGLVLLLAFLLIVHTALLLAERGRLPSGPRALLAIRWSAYGGLGLIFCGYIAVLATRTRLTGATICLPPVTLVAWGVVAVWLWRSLPGGEEHGIPLDDER